MTQFRPGSDISGFEHLSAQLESLADGLDNKVLKKASTVAMRPALLAARAAAPTGDSSSWNPPRKKAFYTRKTYLGNPRSTGYAARNVATKGITRKDGLGTLFLLGVKPEAFYAVTFFERGTATRKGTPWLEPAFKRSIPEVDRIFRSELKKKIDEALRK